METETQQQQHLPPDLITGILLRLPVKSLVRFKAVCKFWRSLISDLDFARSHYELAAPRLLFCTYDGIQTMDLDGPLHSNRISEPVNVDFLPNQRNILIEGSCRGFLLLESNDSLYLWNPSTRVHKPIPPSPLYTKYHRYLYGFGYDSSKDDYLVVQVPVIPKSESPKCLALVQFFSMRANMWKYIEGNDWPRLNLSSSERKPGLLFNEAIHWLAYDRNKSRDVIIAFDLMEKRLLEIPEPDDLTYDLSYYDFWVHGRFLSLSVLRSDTLEVWVMEKYKVHSSWTKTLLSLSVPSKFLSPILSTKRGDIVMKSISITGLVKYTDKGEQLEHRCYQGYLESQVPMYTESIFSLHGDSEQS